MSLWLLGTFSQSPGEIFNHQGEIVQAANPQLLHPHPEIQTPVFQRRWQGDNTEGSEGIPPCDGGEVAPLPWWVLVWFSCLCSSHPQVLKFIFNSAISPPINYPGEAFRDPSVRNVFGGEKYKALKNDEELLKFYVTNIFTALAPIFS